MAVRPKYEIRPPLYSLIKLTGTLITSLLWREICLPRMSYGALVTCPIR